MLQVLADAHLIDSAAAERAAAEPLGLRPPGGSYVPAYLDLVRRHLKRDYAEADLAAAGLAVYTSLDPRAQAAAERALTRNLTRLDAASRVRDAHLEGAVVVAEPNSGDVVAVVGGREIGADGFNRALDARRPIGSLVKPAVYLAALETGRYNAATMLEDAPIELKLGDGSIWAPQNFTHETYGQVPVVRALAESMNLATVRLGLDVGLPQVADTLQRLGLETRPALNPSLLLGTVEMTPLEVVQVYTSLANGGFRARLRAVRAVLDEHGRPLKSFKVQVETAAPPADVYALDRMLMLVTTRGTARAASARLPPGMVVAGKTGTSSDTRDSWFAGFTGSYLAVVWVGYDDNRVTGLTGAAGALPVWADTIASLKSASFQPVPPESVEDRWIGFEDGLETTPECSADAVVVAVPKGTALPGKPGCGPSPRDSLGDKIKAWFKHMVHLRTCAVLLAAAALSAACSLFRPTAPPPPSQPSQPSQVPNPPQPQQTLPPLTPRRPGTACAREQPLARHPLAGDAGQCAGRARRSPRRRPRRSTGRCASSRTIRCCGSSSDACGSRRTMRTRPRSAAARRWRSRAAIAARRGRPGGCWPTPCARSGAIRKRARSRASRS